MTIEIRGIHIAILGAVLAAGGVGFGAGFQVGSHPTRSDTPSDEPAVRAAQLAADDKEIQAYREQANEAAARSDVRASIPSMEAYYSDNGTYVGANDATLRTIYDSHLSSSITTANLTATSYCIQSVVGGHAWKVNGPGGALAVGTC